MNPLITNLFHKNTLLLLLMLPFMMELQDYVTLPMANFESLKSFYRHKLNDHQNLHEYSFGDFNIFNIADRVAKAGIPPTFIRRDFYKVMLFQGANVFHYGDKSICVNDDTLLFFNPAVPYTYDPLNPSNAGYFCVFKSEFLNKEWEEMLQHHPLFSAGAKPVFSLNQYQAKVVKEIFMNMERLLNLASVDKYDLIRKSLTEIIEFASSIVTEQPKTLNGNAGSRIISVFSELLERQFPIESKEQRFSLRSPKAVAERLAIHVNHLNRIVKRETGKTTSKIIFERLASEAITLLKYSDWSIREISHVLGFETPAHFNHFFKKQTHTNPLSYRTG